MLKIIPKKICIFWQDFLITDCSIRLIESDLTALLEYLILFHSFYACTVSVYLIALHKTKTYGLVSIIPGTHPIIPAQCFYYPLFLKLCQPNRRMPSWFCTAIITAYTTVPGIKIGGMLSCPTSSAHHLEIAEPTSSCTYQQCSSVTVHWWC